MLAKHKHLLYWIYSICTLGVLIFSPAHADSRSVFQGNFLIASEQMQGTAFDSAVIYVTKDGEHGTYGLIVNRPTGIALKEIFPENIHPHASDDIYFGGPQHAQFIFTLAQTEPQENLHNVAGDIFIGAGNEILDKLMRDKSHPKVRAFAGFASWAPGQLEEQLKSGDWVVAPGNPHQLFDTKPDEMWKMLYKHWGGSWL